MWRSENLGESKIPPIGLNVTGIKSGSPLKKHKMNQQFHPIRYKSHIREKWREGNLGYVTQWCTGIMHSKCIMQRYYVTITVLCNDIVVNVLCTPWRYYATILSCATVKLLCNCITQLYYAPYYAISNSIMHRDGIMQRYYAPYYVRNSIMHRKCHYATVAAQ